MKQEPQEYAQGSQIIDPMYKSQEIVEKEFDEEFGSSDGQDFFGEGQRISRVLSFIANLRLQDKKDLLEETKKGENWRKGYQQGYDEALVEINEWAEEKKGTCFDYSTSPKGVDYSYNQPLHDLQAFIKSLRKI